MAEPGDRPPVYRYRVSGLTVQSDLALPGLRRLASDAPPDVTIAAGVVPTMLPDPVLLRPRLQLGATQALSLRPGIGRFLIEGGSMIHYAAEPDAAPEELTMFLVGTVFAVLLHQRGDIVLHASAIAVGGCAVLFCGRSGAGKSTLAAALAEQGYPLLSDDQCAIALDTASRPMLRPDGRQLKLWTPSIAALALDGRRQGAVPINPNKFYVDPAQRSEDALAIGAIYQLSESDSGAAIEVKIPNLADRTALLVANAYRPVLMQRMGRKSRYLQASAAMAGQIGVFQFVRPKQFAVMPRMLGVLAEHWQDIGLVA